MNMTYIVKRAAELAYEEDADQVVAKIDGQWAIANIEDEGRIALMGNDAFLVHADGPSAQMGDYIRRVLLDAHKGVTAADFGGDPKQAIADSIIETAKQEGLVMLTTQGVYSVMPGVVDDIMEIIEGH